MQPQSKLPQSAFLTSQPSQSANLSGFHFVNTAQAFSTPPSFPSASPTVPAGPTLDSGPSNPRLADQPSIAPQSVSANFTSKLVGPYAYGGVVEEPIQITFRKDVSIYLQSMMAGDSREFNVPFDPDTVTINSTQVSSTSPIPRGKGIIVISVTLYTTTSAGGDLAWVLGSKRPGVIKQINIDVSRSP